jgi:aminoglycoside phosphotransferase (APT) family kinase protein
MHRGRSRGMDLSGSNSSHETEELISALLSHLDMVRPEDEGWEGWQVQRVAGGQNNLLYRATNRQHDLAVKFTRRDARDRAGREYRTLRLLDNLGLHIVPKPILLNRDRYTQPVVVETWLSGAVSAELPTRTEWNYILEHYAAIHSITPEASAEQLPRAVLTLTDAQSGVDWIEGELEQVPPGDRRTELQELVAHLRRAQFPEWPEPQPVLCRVDPNLLNFVRRPNEWLSVDWENSGWGDPAFEIADLMTHPAYERVPTSELEWLVDTYQSLSTDRTIAIRIHAYYKIMIVRWALFFGRKLLVLHEARQSEGLSGRPPGWWEELPARYLRYLNLARATLD